MDETTINEFFNILSSKTYKEIKFAKDLDSHIKRFQKLKTIVEEVILFYGAQEIYAQIMLENLDIALSEIIYFLEAKAAKKKKSRLLTNHFFSTFRDAHKIKKMFKKLELIARGFHNIRRTMNEPVEKHTQMVSNELLWENSYMHMMTEEVIGRDKDRDEIINMLFDDSETLSVVSIVGIRGVGKTTLAKYVYHDERVKSWFDIRCWVSNSTTEDFDVHKVLFEILATFGVEMPSNCDIVQMYDFFKQKIGEKKLLLVLDDVGKIWDQVQLQRKWKELRSLLKIGGNGCRILATTCDENVARIIEFVKPFMLGDLTEEDSWLLFQKIAFTQFQESGVEEIGREIVKKCRNVPLIRILGGLLSMKCTVMEWMAFRDEKLAKFSENGSDRCDSLQMLELSYNELDKRLKLCFAYCSLFPKGHKCDKYEMIRLWISLGYIESSERRRLEDTAEYCIRMLAIQGYATIDKKSSRYFVMHNLVHEYLALFVMDFKNYGIKVDELDDDDRVRHLLLVGKKSVIERRSFWKMTQLQSLLVLKSDSWYNLYDSERMFNRFPKLRIISLSNLGIEEVPSSLCELFNLRYLDLSHNPLSCLPDSITQLVELLSLNVSFCTKLHEFPKGITKLVKLRHFINEKCFAPMPKEVTKLTYLQTIDELRLDISEWFPRETDCGLAEFNFIINHLIDGTAIKFNGDALSRSFKAKQEDWESKGKLVCLDLYFKEGTTKGDDEKEALQPETNLIKLIIDGYTGEWSPNWMNNGNQYFEKLAEIRLVNLEGCRSLGSFGMLPHLKRLTCYQSRKVEYIEDSWCGYTMPFAPLFPSLVELRLFEMPKLKRWYKVSEGESNSSSSIQVNILLKPQLAFPQLQKLYVTQMEFVISMTTKFRGFSSLEGVSISNCEDFKAIPDGIPNLSKLKRFELRNCCEELKARCQEPIGEDWPKIKHIPHVRTFS